MDGSDPKSTPQGSRESAVNGAAAVPALGAVGGAEAVTAGDADADAAKGNGNANGNGRGDGRDERAAPSGAAAVAPGAEASSGGAPPDPISARTGTGTGTGTEAGEGQRGGPRARVARPPPSSEDGPNPDDSELPVLRAENDGLRRRLAEMEAEVAALRDAVSTLTGRAETAVAELAELRGRLSVTAGAEAETGEGVDAAATATATATAAPNPDGAADGGRDGGFNGDDKELKREAPSASAAASSGDDGDGSTAAAEAKQGSGAAAAKRRRRGNAKTGGATTSTSSSTPPSGSGAGGGRAGGGNRKIKHDLRPVIPHHTAVPRPATDDVLPNDRSKYADQWRKRFAELVSFKLRYNHTSVPKDYNVNPALSHWVQKQRHRRRNFDTEGGNAGHLTQERIDALDSIGFEWNPGRHRRDDVWEMRFRQLIEYKRQHGHCNVPEKYPQNRQLGKWVGNQRHRKKLLDAGRVARGMNKSRVEKLEAVGFEWVRKRGGGIGGGSGGGGGGGGDGVNVPAVGGDTGASGEVGIDPSGNVAAAVDAGASGGDEGIIGDVGASHQNHQHQHHQHQHQQQQQQQDGDEGLREGQVQVQIGVGGLRFDGADVGVRGGSNAAHAAAVPAGTVVTAAGAAANLDGERYQGAMIVAAAVAEAVPPTPPPARQPPPPPDLVHMAAEGGTVHEPELHHVQAVRVVQESQPDAEDGGAEVGITI